MTIQATCGRCNKKYDVRDEMAGKQVRCTCKATFTVPAARAAAAPRTEGKRSPMLPLLVGGGALLALVAMVAGVAAFVVLAGGSTPEESVRPPDGAPPQVAALAPGEPAGGKDKDRPRSETKPATTEKPGGEVPGPGPSPEKPPRPAKPVPVPTPIASTGGTPGGEKSPPPETAKEPEKPAGDKTKPPETAPSRDKLAFKTIDKLDRGVFDIKLPEAKPGDQTPAVWDGHTNHVRCVAFSDDGQFVLSSSGDVTREIVRPADNSIRVWDALRGKQVHKLEGFKEALDGLALSPGGRFALFSHTGYWQDGRFVRTKSFHVSMWDILSKKAIGLGDDLAGAPAKEGDPKPKPRFVGLNDSVFTTAISPDGKTVAAADGQGGLILWETGTGKQIAKTEVKPIRGFIRGVGQVKFTPDGRHLVVVSADYTLRFYRTDTGEVVSKPLSSHLDIVWTMDVTELKGGVIRAVSGGGSRQRLDGRGFEPGARGSAIRLWDLNTGKEMRRFSGHTRDVLALAFCPNGRCVVSGSMDQSVRLWDADSGKELRVLGRHDAMVRSVAVAPDGRSCVSGGDDCKVRFWKIPSVQDLIAALDKNDLPALKKAAEDMDVIGVDVLDHFPKLLKPLSHDNPEFRRLATQILLRAADLSKKELPFDRSQVKDMVKVLQVNESTALQILVVRGLGAIGAPAAEAAPALVKLCQAKGENEVATAAVQALGQIGEKGKETLAALLAVVLSESPEVLRLAALNALAQLDLSGYSTTRMVERTSAEGEPSAKVRLRTADLLEARLAALKSEDLADLRPLLQHKDSTIVLVGLNVVIQKKQGAVLVPNLVALMNHTDVKVSARAGDAIQALGSEAKTALPTLLTALKDGDKSRRLLLALLTVSIDKKDEKVQELALPVLIGGLHPDRLQVGGKSMKQQIEKALVGIGQPAVDAIFKTFETIAYRGRENGTHRRHLFVVLQGLAAECKSKDNYARLKPIRAKEAREYEDTRAAAGRALAAMDPG